MKPQRTLPPLLLALSASTMTTAQLLTQGNGNLPSCASSCSILTAAQSQCGSNWNCFCTTVWANSNHALTTMCASACTSATDNSAINTWYTANCGSDNGASEHGGSGSGVASSSANAATSTSTTNSGGTSASGPNDVDQGQPTWWDGHWKWIIMVIVLFFGLLLLALLGRWLKKRHDRKQDQIREGFNAGITSRGPTSNRKEKEKNTHSNNRTSTSDFDNTTGGRDSPARTRDAFMPYGYGYTRSESRLASHDRASPLARGSTPMGEMEKEIGVEEPAPARKKEKGGRKVLVREKSGRSGSGGEEGEIRRAR